MVKLGKYNSLNIMKLLNDKYKYIFFFSEASCFILLGISLLYANSGTTNLDGIYVITSLSDLASLSAMQGENTMASPLDYVKLASQTDNSL